MPEFTGYGMQKACGDGDQESIKDPWLLLVEVSIEKMRKHISVLEKEAKSIELMLDAHRRRLQ